MRMPAGAHPSPGSPPRAVVALVRVAPALVRLEGGAEVLPGPVSTGRPGRRLLELPQRLGEPPAESLHFGPGVHRAVEGADRVAQVDPRLDRLHPSPERVEDRLAARPRRPVEHLEV